MCSRVGQKSSPRRLLAEESKWAQKSSKLCRDLSRARFTIASESDCESGCCNAHWKTVGADAEQEITIEVKEEVT